ncbi:MAG: sulfatase-like hydrolase/transferase [Phycisphaerae bacterium]
MMRDDSRASDSTDSQPVAKSHGSGSTRRDFLLRSALAAAAPAVGIEAVQAASVAQSQVPARRPNIIFYHSDQFRWDCICAAGLNPMDFTPNLDAMYRRGTVFSNFITNQPLCAPSRSCWMTGQYATTTGVWKNGPGLRPDAVTMATELTRHGYTANYIGKWHLAPYGKVGPAAVPAKYRGGFTGMWLGANAPESSTQPYNSCFWDNDDQPVRYDHGEYRVDFLTRHAETFLRQKHEKPFLLVISQLEPHQQNGPCEHGDVFGFVPPHGYEKAFRSCYVPQDLRFFPGDWQYEMNNYYGCIKAIDESLGRIFKTLREENLEENTIVIFLSDHGCHFRTRNSEYKRSPHDSSVHVPLMINGGGFNNRRVINELVSMIDITPTVLDMAGIQTPACMQGRSFLPLVTDEKAREAWSNEVLIQTSEAQIARVLRTPEWTYAALAPDAHISSDPSSMHYQDYQLYNNRADPHQLLNMVGRVDTRWPDGILLNYIGHRSMREVTAHLRNRLIERIVEAGEPRPHIRDWPFYA